MLDVPRHRFFQALVQGRLGFPAELALDFGRVDCVAAIVPRPVGDERDELAVAAALRTRGGAVERVAKGVHQLEVRTFVAAADVVRLTRRSLFRGQTERLAM